MATGLSVGRVGANVRDDASLVIDRPGGSGDWLFIWFHGPTHVLDRGERRRVAAPAWALYRPTAAQWLSGVDRPMRTSWFHWDGPAAAALVRRLGLPCDALQPADGIGPLAPLLREVQRERLHREPGWEDAAAALIEAILIRLARAARRPAVAPRRRAPGLREARERLHERLAQRWTVAGIARIVGLSPSRLTARWRAEFGRSPIDDLIEARLARACWLLESTTLPVAAVAQAVGFSEPCHFSRLFRARLGRAPRAWQSGR